MLLGHDVYAPFAMHSLSAEDLRRGIAQGLLRVAEADGRPVGFALCGEVDGHAHLHEMDVLPGYGRRGIGSALLESVCERAGARGLTAMTLATLRDVPWNAPFYAMRGFVEMPEGDWGEELAAIVDRERMLGFPMRLRVVMQRWLVGCERRSNEVVLLCPLWQRVRTHATDSQATSGSCIATHNPPPSRLCIDSRPPCASTISRVSASPRPVPLRLVE